MTASVAIDVLSGVTVPAKVTKISPTATISGGVVNYGVTVTLDTAPTGQQPAGNQISKLKQALSVTVTITTQNKQNVLMVPDQAIIRQGQTTTVQMTGANPPQVRTVIVGVSDGQNTEIVSGLSEGEKVLVQPAAALATPTPGLGGGLRGLGG